jgi:hypothetical protein
MKIKCPNCNHEACNGCARVTIKTKMPQTGGTCQPCRAERNVKCCACKTDSRLSYWLKVKETEPRYRFMHPDFFSDKDTKA